jgi:hypothetical protein
LCQAGACCHLLQAVASKTITFSSLTTPQIFQMAMDGAVEKRQGRCVSHSVCGWL